MALLGFLALRLLSRRRAREREQPSDSLGWSEEEKLHRETERKYWRISSAISGLALISAVAGACFALGAYQEAKRQASVAQQALDSSTRPWVFIDNITAVAPLIVDNGIISISVKAQVKNYAQVPALSPDFPIRILQIKPGFNFPEKKAKELCNETGAKRVTSAIVVAPSQAAETTLSSNNINYDQTVLFTSFNTNKKLLCLMLLACIHYTCVDGKHHRIASYHIITDRQFGPFFSTESKMVPAERIEFSNEMMVSHD